MDRMPGNRAVPRRVVIVAPFTPAPANEPCERLRIPRDERSPQRIRSAGIG